MFNKDDVRVKLLINHDADIYLLDDPLSAVDTHVGRELFDRYRDLKAGVQ